MLEIEKDATYRLRDNMVLHAIEDLNKYWLLNLKTGDIYDLNEVSAEIMMSLSKGANLHTISKDIVGRYEIDEIEAEKDIKEVLKLCLKEDLVFKEGGC